MTGITPADLAKFIHRVPVGATIPADVEHAVGSSGTISLAKVSRDYEMPPDALPRWTAEPVLTPKHACQMCRALVRGGRSLEAEYAAACEAIRAAERAVAKARKEAEALRPRAESLYRELQKAGRR